MNSEQSGVHEDRVSSAPGSRRRWVTWSAIILVLYVAYIGLCFYMETEARARFEVPTKADIEAIDDRNSRIRAESARGRALEEMREWTPYVVYSTGLGVVIFLGTGLATVFGAWGVWRGVRRDSTRAASRIVVGVLLIVLGSLFLLGWPPIVAQNRFEGQQTALR